MSADSETATGQALLYQVRVRPSDTDLQGIVHASRYSVFFEAAMIEAFRTASGDYDVLASNNVDFVLAEMTIRYLAPARFDELLEIAVWRRGMGTTSLTIDYRGRVGDREVVHASARYVAFAVGELTKTAIPGPVRAALDSIPLLPDEAPRHQPVRA
ncbi:acyl-CoA thioesterase [Streptomyces boncukensis]|uniref:Acyl-CoA thioesterase n=1 Tax=Streptomyces boncukensis TaxID=2711219 RepID=A0A6G4WP62_9ACTN|nr:thioesterase family protein [Streptomyces boncukensis]NGO66878.1 acyl-CoA thioesterase [Streptomyces boncukensis]